MRLKLRVPLFVLIGIAIVYGAAKGAMYLRVKSTMDDLVQQASAQAEITYQGIGTDLINGAASVEGIEVRPLQFEQSVFIEQVRFASDDRWALLTGADWQSRQQPPPAQMSLSLIGIRLPLDAAMLETLQQQADAQAALSGQPPLHACDGGMNLDPQLLSELGFEELTVDVDLDYRFNELAERLTANMAFDVHNMQSVQMSVEFDGLIPQDLHSGDAARAGLADIDMRITVPRSFGDRYMKQCAKRKQQTVDSYREALLQRMFADLQQVGVTLGTGLQQAMSDYYRDWGEMRVRVHPDKPLGMLQMMSVTPDRLIDMLGVSLFINQAPVADLDFSFDMQQLARLQSDPAPQGEYDPLAAPPLPKRVRIIRRYETVPLGLLDQQIGEAVKIQPFGQPLREGTLVAIRDGEAVVEQRTHGGSVTSYVRLDDIESLQVQRVEQKPLQ